MSEITLLGRGSSHQVKVGPKQKVKVHALRYVRPGERDFLKILPSELPKKTLFLYGADSPLMPAVLRALSPEMKIDIFTNELHDKRIAEKKFSSEHQINVFTGSDLQLEDDHDMLVFAPTKYFDRMLFFDTLERVNLIYPKGTDFYIVVPQERLKDFRKKIDQELRGVKILSSTRSNTLFKCITRGDDVKKKWSERVADVAVSTMNAEFTMQTRPGVFSHGRADVGGVALSEAIEVIPGENILDLGCGAGLIGLALARRQLNESPDHGGSVVMVDSNIRSIECCKNNIEINGFQNCEAIASDLYETEKTFDLIVGNPPYFAGQRIGEYFIETAMKYLNATGRLAIVSKHGEQLAEVAKDFGFKTTTTKRKGYDISLCRR
ncbi:methyltransferase [Lentisphaera marina]|uniref:class I SAM-dependent methyltransferase n=1 Tax=Lentisphaera marina TaxID=1111041 RepID=UPI00236554D3|nr:methyltransferase [Lentisphaera marina]MDD7984470.1 methyltransferase [Lentisphaera marina]